MKPWLAHYDADIPASLAPYPEKTLLDYLGPLARDHGAKPALLFKGASFSYGELESRSDAFAAALASLGVRPGDRVALLLPNCPQFFIAEFGAWKAGAVVVPLNPIYSERELEAALASTLASTVVALTPFYQRIKNIQPRTQVRRVIATSIKEYLPPALRVLFTLFREKKDGHRITVAGEDSWFQALLRQHQSAPRPSVTVRPDDRAVILSSGGTTGTPKGVVGLHRHYVAAGLQLYEWTKSAKKPWADVIMLPLPMFHVYANLGVQPLAFIAPNPLSIVPNPRDIGDLLKTIRQVKPAFFNGIPTLYTAILNHPNVRAGKVDLSSIKLCFSGAAALMAETKRQFEQATGSRIVEGYSLTEGMMACCVNPVKGTNKLGSIGVPLPDVEARIVDAENGVVEMPTGQVGELIMRAPQHMSEYWQNPAETADTLRRHGEGGPWIHTGDLAYMDEDGYLFIVDRKKDMMKTSGFQVWPREIEEVISTHPAVKEASAAGVPDAAKGEVPRAWVVLKAGASASEDELRAFCRERLAPYKVPAKIEFRTDLPKTMVGKVLRRVLVEETKLSGIAIAVLASAVLMAGPPAASLQRPAEGAADVVFRNGRIYAVDVARTSAEAIAVRGEKVAFVGSNAGASSLTGPGTRIVDLEGRMVLPGFVDGHNHVYLRAEALYWVTLSGTTLEGYRAAIRSFLQMHPNVTQIRGVGFNLNFVLETARSAGRAPRLLLDDLVARDIPAVFLTNGHHQIWANSRAIQNARVTKNTPDPLGAIIERDSETGEPTGIFREFGAQNLIIAALPQPDFTVEEYREAVLSFQKLAGERGVTSVLVPVHYPTENFLEALQTLDGEARLTLRYDLALWANETRGTAQIPEFRAARDRYRGRRFRIDSIKIFGTGDRGALVWNQKVLNETVAALDKERFRVYVHVIGNAAANEAILDAFEFARTANLAWDARHAITHVNNGAAPAAARYRALGVRADGHPVPRAFFDLGVASSSSSDYPVRDFFPFVRIATGVGNGVPRDAMIASHTIAGAELMFAEREIGSLETGKSTDLVVLDRNLLDTPAAEIERARVLLTLFAGKEVFRDPSLD